MDLGRFELSRSKLYGVIEPHDASYHRRIGHVSNVKELDFPRSRLPRRRPKYVPPVSHPNCNASKLDQN